MAYIDAEKTKKIRNAIKAAFPGFKFSVSKKDFSSLHVSVMAGPLDFGDLGTINEFHVDSYKESHGEEIHAFLKKLIDLIKTEGEWFDKSDSMTDYFHTAFYMHVRIGKWNRPYQQI